MADHDAVGVDVVDPPAPKTQGRRQAPGWYLAWVVSGVYAALGTMYAVQIGLGYDSHAYWAAVQHLDRLYDAPALSRDAYLYSPLFAQAVWPLGRLPWPVFWCIWAAAAAACFAWLLRSLPNRWFAPALVASVPEVLTGNIYAFMAVCLVLGVSRGTPWLVLGLTKATPGLVGVVWLAGTRRIPALLRGMSLGAALVGVSYVLAPEAWRAWVDFLRTGSPSSTAPRGVGAATLVLLAAGLAVALGAAVTRRAWLLPVAVILVSPTFGLNTLTLLAAVPRLARGQDSDSSGDTSSE